MNGCFRAPLAERHLGDVVSGDGKERLKWSVERAALYRERSGTLSTDATLNQARISALFKKVKHDFFS